MEEWINGGATDAGMNGRGGHTRHDRRGGMQHGHTDRQTESWIEALLLLMVRCS